SMFGEVAPGYGRVKAIQDWIHQNITYKPGSTDSNSTAGEVLEQRAGVCRDFAHLGITFCRALNIPARLVVGYVWFDEPPQDFHAVFEAWLGGQWVLFDPTGMAPVDRLVRIGTGRDAKDVAFSTMFGAMDMVRKEVTVLEHDPRPRNVVAPTPAPQLARLEAA
ncbi:MAG: transglutaminase, partial [Ramlibacter sp.]|nr:transglutaminase [Ramlibacter sp.]